MSKEEQAKRYVDLIAEAGAITNVPGKYSKFVELSSEMERIEERHSGDSQFWDMVNAIIAA